MVVLDRWMTSLRSEAVKEISFDRFESDEDVFSHTPTNFPMKWLVADCS